MSENGSTYPNGKARDYYGIVAQSVEQNIPGVIVEHAFVSSPYDAVNFLSTNAKLKKSVRQSQSNHPILQTASCKETILSDSGHSGYIYRMERERRLLLLLCRF